MATGREFQPREAADIRDSLNTGGSSQEALQVLALHLPKFLGGSPIAPEDSLRASFQPGRGGAEGNLIELLRNALGLGASGGQAPSPIASPMAPTGGAAPTLPSPGIVPGGGGPMPPEPPVPAPRLPSFSPNPAPPPTDRSGVGAGGPSDMMPIRRGFKPQY